MTTTQTVRPGIGFDGKPVAPAKPLDLKAMQAQLEAQAAEIARLRKVATAPSKASIGFKVGDKGTASVYGVGRFPVSLYGSAWVRVLTQTFGLIDYLRENTERISWNKSLPMPNDADADALGLLDSCETTLCNEALARFEALADTDDVREAVAILKAAFTS